MYDLITVGSATLDVVVRSKDFSVKTIENNRVLCEQFGEKMDVDELKFISGGGATNVAVGASRLGLKAATVCEVGKDFAARVVFDDLVKDHVETKYLIAERLEETAVSILLCAGDGDRSALTRRGAAYQLESRDIPWHDLHKTRWLHLGTLGGDKQLMFDLFEFAKHHALKVSWTPSMKDLDVCQCGELLTETIWCDVLTLNDTEWMSFEKIQPQLLEQIEIIIVTNGKKGGTVFHQGRRLLQYDAFAVKSIEQTGAGDAFATGFIGGQLMNRTILESIEWGKRNAASVTKFLGAKRGLLTKKMIENEMV